jgi:nitrite reductase/ring-hydroxylating ferredoxin subunit
MKSAIVAIILFITLVSCSKNSNENENCKFLLDIGVNEVVNLNLPQYSQLQFAGNSVYIANAGNGGILIASTGADFFAWDAADPNHAQSSCSVLVNSGLNATCGCADKNEYSLVNGLPLNNSELRCGLRNYRVERNGNTLLISN